MRALILGPDHDRGALAAARALAQAGWTVGVGSELRRGLAAASRAAAAWHRIPAPPGQGAAAEPFVRAVSDAVESHGYDLVFASGDAEALALSAGRAVIGALVPYAPHDRVVRAFDKLELARAAVRAGLRVPAGVDPDTSPGGPAADRQIVVKARLQSVVGAAGGDSVLKTIPVSGHGAALERAERIRAAGGEPLFQERVEGALMAYSLVADGEARVIARAQQRAELTWPPHGGVSVRAQTVRIDDNLARRVGALVSELGWVGLAELQFLAPADGEPCLIDFNGRFYGSLALAVAAGANLPAIWAAIATDRPAPEPLEAAAGVRYHWLEGDLRRARVERRRGLVRDVVDTLQYARSAQHSIWAAGDPLPALHYPRHLAAREGRRALRRARERLS